MPAERLELKYVGLRTLMLWNRNPKKHDMGALAASFQTHGFRSPLEYDANLNGGQGGIVAGNGREETLAYMRDQGQDPPRGIGVLPDGDWAVPVLFGLDAKSEAAAMSYAIDHNATTVMGIDGFTALDMARLWDEDAYLGVLRDLDTAGELPVSVDQEDLALLERAVIGPEFPTYDESAADDVVMIECPQCGHRWPK